MSEQAHYSENVDEQPRRQVQITDAMLEADSLIGDIDVATTELAKRLEPVVAHSPEKVSDVGADRATGAPLADEIRRHNDRLAKINQRVRYLLSVLEI